MRTYTKFKQTAIVGGIGMFLLIFLQFPGYSQKADTKNDKEGTVRLKIIKDVNGKKTTIDTTFNLKDKKGEEAYELFMKENDVPGDHHNKAMKNIEVQINDLAKLDSLNLDSLADQEKNIRIRIGDGKHIQIEGLGNNDFFDIPEPPAPPVPPDAEQWMENEMPMAPEMEEGQGNLMDVLRSIPMNRIRNFSIKEQKHGTRIIIEVDRAPVLDFPPRQQRMMYMRHGNGRHHHGTFNSPGRERRIIIEKDNEHPGEK